MMTRHKNMMRMVGLLAAMAIGSSGAWAQEKAAPAGKPADMKKPVKVFILMGQSNMVGMGKKASLEAAVKEKKKYS